MNSFQQDLFSQPTSSVNTSVKANVGTSASTTTEDKIPTLQEYTNKIAKKIWPKEHTRRGNLRAVKYFSEYKDYGQLTMDKIRRKQIYDFIEYVIEERGISENTGNRYLAAISRVLREANEKEIIDNPIKLKYASVKSGRPRWFTEEEQEKIVKWLHDHRRPEMAWMVVLSCNTGMRRGEILAITHRDAEVTDDGKWLYLPGEVIKTGEDRYIPLNEKARVAYNALMERVPYKAKLSDPKYTMAPLISLFTHDRFYNAWKKMRKDIARGDKDFVFHVCRHTAATKLANDVKANAFVIADILGHKSERTTRRYVHAKKDALMDAVSGL